jgi:hypothetical protein
MINMSNTLPGGKILPEKTSAVKKTSFRRRLLEFPPARKVFMSLYDWIFAAYYRN